MRKKRTLCLGTTLLEAVFVCSFIGMIFLLLYKSLDLSMKTNYSVLNGDSIVKQSAFSFEEIITKKVRETDADGISIFNDSNWKKKIVPSGLPTDEAVESSTPETLTIAVSMPGHIPNWTPSGIEMQDNSPNPFGLIPLQLNLDDASPPANNPEQQKALEELKTQINLFSYDCIYIYYYDREGTWNSQIAKKGADRRDSKYTMYEVIVKIRPALFQKKISAKRNKEDIRNYISNLISRRDANVKYRKIASNLVYFSADMSAYPLISFKSMFMYGRGGNSSRQVIEDTRNRKMSEVFELGFSAMPYYY